MPENILDPGYWKARIVAAPPGEPHHAVFKCPLDRWLKIEAAHRKVLGNEVAGDTYVLDVGCGWGRLLDLMPPWWKGAYCGVDVSPDFINMARARHELTPRKNTTFLVTDARSLPMPSLSYDLAVCVSIRPMVRRNLGDAAWAEMEAEVNRVARRVLYLEYDPENPVVEA